MKFLNMYFGISSRLPGSWDGKEVVQMFTHFTRAPVFWEERCWVISICTRNSLWLLMVWVEILHLVPLLRKQGGKKRIFTGGASGKEPACQQRRLKRCGFNPWIEKISWRRAWQPTPVFLPGESPWTEEPGGLQSIVLERAGHDWSDLACMHRK